MGGATDMKRMGGILIELIIVIGILSIIGGVGVKFAGLLKQSQFRVFQEELVALCHASRHKAMAMQKEVLIDRKGDVVQVQIDGDLSYQIEVPGSIVCNFPKKLGFTSTGSVKHSGSIRCSQGGRKFRVSLSIGNSRIGVYDA